MKISVEEAAVFLRENDNYLILMHASPDGDTVGCGYALCGTLQRMGKKAKAVCPEEIPHRFDYMKKAVVEQEFEYSTVVCVDVADTKLLGDMEKVGNTAKLCIDHHLSNTGYAERTVLKPEYAACCEILYEVIYELGVPFDKALADCIYTGTATDTGCFKFSNTSAQTHRIAAEMIDNGADYGHINFVNFDLKTQGRIKLEQEALKTIRYFSGGKVAMITVSLALRKSISDIDNEDVGALANIPRQIEGVDIGICMKEKKDQFKASVRTSERINAAQLCQKFGGGGHERAGGCSFYNCTLSEAEDAIIKAAVEMMSDLHD